MNRVVSSYRPVGRYEGYYIEFEFRISGKDDRSIYHTLFPLLMRPPGLMDKALPSGGKDSEFESWGGRYVLVLPHDDDILNRLLCFMKERVLSLRRLS